MPRLVRRRPLFERITSYLNPWDFMLWLSEEIDSSDWDKLEKDWAMPLGFGLNFIFMVARANSATQTSRADADIFGDGLGGLSWFSWLVCFFLSSSVFFLPFLVEY